jgi:UDP-N-acetylmuramyl tripeptide synthase
MSTGLDSNTESENISPNTTDSGIINSSKKKPGQKSSFYKMPTKKLNSVAFKGLNGKTSSLSCSLNSNSDISKGTSIIRKYKPPLRRRVS